MLNQHHCPCCSSALLHHISHKRSYWFCMHCHEEMPDLEGIIRAKSVSPHWISKPIVERQHLVRQERQRDKLYRCIRAMEELQHLAFSDSLTHIANRRRFEAYLAQEWRRMAREQAPLSLLIADLDFFKAYNDAYGHPAGDKCLQQVVKAIVQVVQRPADLVARYGGEEFVIVLPNTRAQGAVRVAEAIRSGVKKLKIAQSRASVSPYVTVSLGVASIVPSHEYSPEMLIAAADQSLYQAKAQGRDRVVLHETLLRQIKLVKSEPHPTELPTPASAPEAKVRKSHREVSQLDMLMSYVAYYTSRGKDIVSPHDGCLTFEQSVYQYWGYHRDFLAFWQQLQQREDFRELYLEGDLYGFGQFLDGSYTVGECARCNLPVPLSEGGACMQSNCTLCEEPEPMLPPSASNGENPKDELESICVLALGTPPADYQYLQKWFAVNGFAVTFARAPEAIASLALSSTVDLVLIHAEISEPQGRAWARQLSQIPQFQGVPIIALSTQAGYGLPWMEQTLGIEDYIITPYGGERLAEHLHQISQLQSNDEVAELHWFPR